MTSRREYLPYAVIETHFVFADPRFKSLRPSSKLTFLLLWCRAFHTRRQRLPNWYTTSSLHEDTGHDTRTLEKCVTELQQKCLITVDPDGRITVLGVKGKGKVKWKDNGELIDQTLDQTTPSVRGSRKGKWKWKGKGKGKEDVEREIIVPDPLKGLVLYEADKKLCEKWGELYPAWKKAFLGIDILAEVRMAHAWEIANPAKQKKQRGRFLTNWLTRAQDKKGGRDKESVQSEPPDWADNPPPLPESTLAVPAVVKQLEKEIPHE